MGFIKNLFARKKKGDDDYIFVDEQVNQKGDSRVVAIPAHGNHPVFTEGGAVIIPKDVKQEERRMNGSAGKKYFFGK